MAAAAHVYFQVNRPDHLRCDNSHGEGSCSIACITIDPNDHNTIWVGTGENVGGRHFGYGNGIYRSRDGGKTWDNRGLGNSKHIGMIRIDPRDSNVINVAAQGPLWSSGGDRGLFKSTDGGEGWENILSSGEFTSANEVHLHLQMLFLDGAYPASIRSRQLRLLIASLSVPMRDKRH